jgi:hypothetical protein
MVAGVSNDMKPDVDRGHGRWAELPSTGRRRTTKPAARGSSFGKTDDDKLETACSGSLTWNLAVPMLERTMVSDALQFGLSHAWR